MSVVSYLKLTPKQEFMKEFRLYLEELSQLVRHQKGFIDVEVLHPEGGTTDYVLLSEWESEADFKAWEHSPRHQEIMEDYNRSMGQGYVTKRMNRYR